MPNFGARPGVGETGGSGTAASPLSNLYVATQTIPSAGSAPVASAPQTNVTPSITGRDIGGTIQVDLSAEAETIIGNLFTVTFAAAKTNVPIVNLFPINSTALTYGTGSFVGAISFLDGTGFSVYAGQSIFGPATLLFGYTVTDTQTPSGGE